MSKITIINGAEASKNIAKAIYLAKTIIGEGNAKSYYLLAEFSCLENSFTQKKAEEHQILIVGDLATIEELQQLSSYLLGKHYRHVFICTNLATVDLANQLLLGVKFAP